MTASFSASVAKRVRALAIPLALAGVTLPATASRHVPSRPPAHAPVHVPVHAGAVGTTARHGVAPRSNTHASSTLDATGKTAHHGGRQAIVAAREQQAEALAALRQRSSRYASTPKAKGSRHAVSASQVQTASASSAHGSTHTRHNQQDFVDARTTTRHHLSARPADEVPEAALVQADRPADQRTLDRVHAWYRAGAGTPSQPDAANGPRVTQAAPTTAATAQRQIAAPIVRAEPADTQPTATTATPAMASVAQHATSTATQSQHQTTADDDNAYAESHIPSTAPTEREPLPFQHGSFGTGAAALRTGTVHAGPSAGRAAPAIAVAPPQHVDLKHRGDGMNTALRADAQSDGAVLASGAAVDPLALGSSSRSVEMAAEQTAASPTPRLKLSAPPTAALRNATPAIAAAQSAVRRKDLDPALATTLAGNALNDSSAGAARGLPVPRQITIAGASPALPEEDEGFAENSAGALPVNLTDARGRVLFVPPMKGSHEILVHQNQMALSDGLERIRDDGDLLSLRRNKLLVGLPDEQSTFPDDRLPANRRYARPWTVLFLRDLARAHYTRFGTPLIVTSAARTVQFQRRLVRINGNAAPPTGDIASPHLYGQAIDIGKGHMTLTELMWMRAYLTPVENDGKIDVEEEFQQSCFHISVYRRYAGLPSRKAPAAAPPTNLLAAQDAPRVVEAAKPEKKRHRISTAMLATGLR